MNGAFFNRTVPSRQIEFANRERNEFHGNDFSAMDLIDVSFRDRGRSEPPAPPIGLPYLYLADALRSTREARTQIGEWGDPRSREQGSKILASL